MRSLDPAQWRPLVQMPPPRFAPSPALSEAQHLSLSPCCVNSPLSVASERSTPTTPAVVNPPPALTAAPPTGVQKAVPTSAPTSPCGLPPDPAARVLSPKRACPTQQAAADEQDEELRQLTAAADVISKRARVMQLIYEATRDEVAQHYRMKHTEQDWDGEEVTSRVVAHVAAICNDNGWTKAQLQAESCIDL